MAARWLVATALALVATQGAGQTQALAPDPSNVLSLSAQATIEVSKDVLQVVFTTTKDGADAQAVQVSLKQALDAALSEAKKVAKPGQVDVQTGNFALYPRYSGKGQINGWQGSAELIVRGKDLAGIGQLAGRITTLTVQRVSHELSREAREKVEAEVTAAAIERFRAKAGEVSKLFGFTGYGIRDVQVQLNEAAVPYERATMMARNTMADTAAPLPTEPGKGNVTAMVSGSVRMQK